MILNFTRRHGDHATGYGFFVDVFAGTIDDDTFVMTRAFAKSKPDEATIQLMFEKAERVIHNEVMYHGSLRQASMILNKRARKVNL